MSTDKCCICSQETSEENVLLNGEKYHQDCYKKLFNNETRHDSTISNIVEKINKLNDKIGKYFRERSFLQAIFGSIPSEIKSLQNKREELKKSWRILKEKNKQSLENKTRSCRKYIITGLKDLQIGLKGLET